MRDNGKPGRTLLVLLGFIVVLTILRGALLALGWNWFVRDELFPGIATMSIAVGIGIGALGTMWSGSSSSREFEDKGFGYVATYAFLYYSLYALTLVTAHAFAS
jgi:hypothetical protein